MSCPYVGPLSFGLLGVEWLLVPCLARHMTTFQLGTALGLCRVAQFVSAPSWTFVADLWLGRGAVFCGTLVAWQVTTMAVPWVATHANFGVLLALLHDHQMPRRPSQNVQLWSRAVLSLIHI